MAGPNPFSKTLPLTSLGAVGGPTGTAAGTLRVLVDFVANYDGERAKELEEELKRLGALEDENKKRLAERTKELQALEARADAARDTRAKILEKKQRTEADALKGLQRYYQKILDLQEAGANPRTIAGMKGRLTFQLRQLEKVTGLSEAELRNYVEMKEILGQIEGIEDRITILKQRQHQLQDGIVTRQKESAAIEQFRQQAVPRLLGLGVGAIGGIFGGALFSVGWEAGQAIIDTFTNKLRDMVDPAHNAREAIKDLTQAIESVATDKNLSNLEKATQYLNSFGPGGTALRQGNPEIDRILSLAIGTSKLGDAQEQLNRAVEQGKYGQDLYEDALRKTGNVILPQTDAYKALNDQLAQYTDVRLPAFNDATRKLESNPFQLTREDLQPLVEAGAITATVADNFITARDASEANLRSWSMINDEVDNAAEAASAFADALQRATDEALSTRFDQRMEDIKNQFQAQADQITRGAEFAIAEVDRLARNQANAVNTAADTRIEQLQERLSNLSSGPSGRTRRLQNRLGNLGSGESARTRALQAQIEAYNKAQERRAYLTQLSEIAEERYYLKLEHSLTTTDKYIRISKYSGKARVIAIQASIAQINREAEAQARLNKLLDLQYEASKRILRQEGESVQDYLRRRSVEYRHQIAERQDLDREEKVSRLEELQSEAEYRVALADNTQKRLDTIQERHQKLFLDALQERLKASQEADQAAAAATRKRLQAQLQASQEADQAAYRAKQKAIRDEIKKEEELRDAKIKAINAAATARKLAIELERDRQLKANEKAQDSAEKAEKKKHDIVLKYANKTESDRFITAIQGARRMDQLQAIAGHLAGSSAAFSQLQSYIKGLGLNTVETALILANLAKQRAAYSVQLEHLRTHQPPMAGGGVFTLTNAMNFGRNMRVGEQGDEIGVVLSHRVADILQKQKGGPLVGTINLHTTEDPVQAQYRLKRTIKQAQEAQLT